MDFAFDPAWLEAVMLASVRMAAFLVIAPPFSNRAVPMRVKAGLALALGLAVSPAVVPGYTPPDGAGFLGALIAEIGTGALLGFLVYAVFSAIQSAGGLLDLFGGFQLAQGFDPQSMVQGAQFARFFNLAAIALMAASGAYLVVLMGMFQSFDAIPLGVGIDVARSAESAVDAASGILVSAAQIAGPLLVVLFLADAGLGLLTRVAPALNAFAMGFPLKILLTLALAGTVFVALPGVVDALTETAIGAMRKGW
ncbi:MULTISPECIES: flagellar biosynthetic protein FliR [Agromyces]|jgi:flagellar biosynthetic protein FliR|uniref:flagellar biosynthetic protein FliR n=1 Tax=Agromyces TaxID=33877 RepID=UPI001E586514|nr:MULTISPECIES: flagellar biosynthetic protein FliR [Agromyces]MCD1572419.1 flagellar biosynthetic protein FliR [Agromyces mediolanus]GLU88330.1 flagellar biosynthetic protein FliR [Agromyces sp. NBRC 114283]